jgi:His-Xaa-Ser system protein HxsD
MSENTTRPLFHVENAEIRTKVDLRVYRLTAVQKTAYKLADRCTAVLGETHGDTLPITIAFGPRVVEAEACEIARQFFRELLDQELREKIGEETRAIRSLLLAHAFSRTDLIRRDER